MNSIEEILKDLEMVKDKKEKKKITIKQDTENDDAEFDKKVENEKIWELENNPDENELYKENKAKVESVVKQCHQILYNNGSIVGVKAQNDIVRILLLKFFFSFLNKLNCF